MVVASAAPPLSGATLCRLWQVSTCYDSCQCWQVSLLAGGKVLGGGQWFVVGRGGGIEGG
jgi:hypothetical protein